MPLRDDYEIEYDQMPRPRHQLALVVNYDDDFYVRSSGSARTDMYANSVSGSGAEHRVGETTTPGPPSWQGWKKEKERARRRKVTKRRRSCGLLRPPYQFKCRKEFDAPV